MLEVDGGGVVADKGVIIEETTKFYSEFFLEQF